MMPLTQYKLLTLSEQTLFDAMCEVVGGSPYPLMIKRIVAEGTAEDFRQLVRELREDASESPDQMKEILGENIYNHIIHL